MFRILISKKSKSELKDASDFYGLISQKLKSRFLLNFNHTIEELKLNPYFQIRYDDFRMRQIKNFLVMIHYVIFEKIKTVKIYGIRFARANPDNYPKI